MRLSDWLKKVEQLEKDKEQPADGAASIPQTSAEPARARSAAAVAEPGTGQAQARPVQATPAAPRKEEPASVSAAQPVLPGTAPDVEVPKIEDFLPHLGTPDREVKAPEPVREQVVAEEPKPAVQPARETKPEPVEARAEAPAAKPAQLAPSPARQAAPKPKPKAQAPVEPEPEAEPVQEEATFQLRTLPKHIQSLARMDAREVAQHSYKRSFKESRDSLLERLLDPPLSLEDAARILNVCPTTVRRYTNKGVLPHFRTIGNQRRFRLSDIIVFMESQEKGRRKSRQPRADDSEIDE